MEHFQNDSSDVEQDDASLKTTVLENADGHIANAMSHNPGAIGKPNSSKVHKMTNSIRDVSYAKRGFQMHRNFRNMLEFTMVTPRTAVVYAPVSSEQERI